MKVKVRFNKEWDDNGTCYRKGLVINEYTFNHLYDMLQAEGAREKDCIRAMRLNAPISKKENICFLNLTQSRLVVNKLILAYNIVINTKRARADFNTYIVITKGEK